MLNKLDLELFTILDSEINKTLDESYIETNFLHECHPALFNPKWENKTINIIWKIIKYEQIMSTNSFWTITNIVVYNDIMWIDKYIDIDNIEWSYRIIWHYPNTNTILRYCNKKWYDDLHITHYRDALWITTTNNEWHYELDITKEIKNYSDEQKQELINFLKTL